MASRRKPTAELISTMGRIAALDDSKLLAAVRIKDYNDNTILHLAVEQGNDSILEAILSRLPKGERLSILLINNACGWNVLEWVVVMQHDGIQAVKTILDSLDKPERLTLLNAKCSGDIRRTALHLTALHGSVTMFEALLSYHQEFEYIKAIMAKDFVGIDCLYMAAQGGHAEMLDKILSLYPAPERLALVTTNPEHSCLVSILKLAINNHNTDMFAVILALFPKSDRLKTLQSHVSAGWNMLHYAIHNGNTQVVKKLVELLPVNDRLEACREIDINGNSAINLAVLSENFETIKIILGVYPKKEHIKAITKEYGRNSYSALYMAAYQNLELFDLLLSYIPKTQQMAALQHETKDYSNVLEMVVRRGSEKVFQRIWSLYRVKDRMHAVGNKNNKNDYRLLDQAALSGNLAICTAILEYYQEDQYLEAILSLDRKGSTLIHKAARAGSVQLLKYLLRRCPGEDAVAALRCAKIKDGATVLHQAAISGNIATFDEVLSYYNKPEQRYAITEKDHDGWGMLHLTAYFNEDSCLFKHILAMYPEHQDKRLIAVALDTTKNGSTVLHQAVLNDSVEIVEAVLSVYQEGPARAKAILLKNNDNATVLDLAIEHGNVEVFTAILNCFPENERFETIQLYTLLETAAWYGSTAVFDEILKQYPAGLAQELAVKMTYDDLYDGNNILHHTLEEQYISIFKQLLDLLPKEELIKVLARTNDAGETLLHTVVEWCDHVEVESFLARFTHLELLEAMQIKTAAGQSVLQFATSFGNHSVFEMIFTLYSPEQNAQEVFAANNNGWTVLHIAINSHKLDIVKFILSIFPGESLSTLTQNNFETLFAEIEHIDIDVLKVLLEFIKENKQLPALREAKDKYGNTLLSEAIYASDFDIFERVLACYSPETLLEVIAQTNNEGNTLLHKAASIGSSIVFSLLWEPEFQQFLSQQQLLRVMESANHEDKTVIDIIEEGNQELAIYVWWLYPEKPAMDKIIEAFPELDEDIKYDAGNVTCQILELAHFTQQTIDQGNKDKFAKICQLFLALFNTASARLKNALYISYLAKLDFEDSKKTNRKWAYDAMPASMRTAHNEIGRYRESLFDDNQGSIH